MEHVAKQISQNVKDAIKDIGELLCIFYLYYHFSDLGWSVYRNIDEKGYDILLFNAKKNKRIKIEVKTRQRIISSAKNKTGGAYFMLSEIEKRSSDFLAALWLEQNWFFIVPTSNLKKYTSNGKNFYRFIVKYNKKSKEPDNDSKKYLEKWEQIIL